MLYGNAAMLRPAISAPISLDRLIAPASAATPAHQPIETATTISGGRAIEANTHRSTYLENANPTTNRRIVPPTALRIGPADGSARLGWRARTRIAYTSW